MLGTPPRVHPRRLIFSVEGASFPLQDGSHSVDEGLVLTVNLLLLVALLRTVGGLPGAGPDVLDTAITGLAH